VDAKRRVVYVGTGNSYGPAAADTRDSILALSMDDGHIVWKHQEFSGDAFMLGCRPTNAAGGVCPEKLGPDWDFGGASVMLQTLPNGRDVLVAAGKGGIAIALDPDAQGKVLWRTPLFDKQPPNALGLVLFGGTADGTRAYFPLQQPGGGLVAVRLDSGAIDWKAAIDADRRGQGGAATSIPGVVFTGGWDGILRAVDAKGKVVWAFNAAQPFETVNGVQAKGGSLAVTGPAVVDGMVYLGAGYIGVQGGASGNVLLAFSVK
jgi:polyvinyl alcohol dehydrogenase (cytochrome)